MPCRPRASVLARNRRRRPGPSAPTSSSAWAAATSISACSRSPAPHSAGHLERDDQRVGDRRARLEAARERDHRDAVGARLLRQLAAGGGDDRRARRAPRAASYGGERLLGVARVARAQHGRVGRRPRRQPVVAREHDRARRAVAERRARERAADRRAAHPGDHQPAWRVVWLEAGRLDAPQRVAQVLGQSQDVAELAAGVDFRDRVTGQAQASCSKSDRSRLGAARQGRYGHRPQACCPHRSRPPRRARRRPRYGTVAPIVTPGPTIAPLIVHPAPDGDAVEQHRALDLRPLADLDAAPSTPGRRRSRRAPTMQSVPTTAGATIRPGDLHVVEQAHPGGTQPRADLGARRCPRGCRRSPAGSGSACRCRASSRRLGSRTARVRRASGTHHARSRCCVPAGAMPVEHLALEDVGAGVDQVGVDHLSAPASRGTRGPSGPR